MASATAPNATQVRQILATISKCSELWGEVRVLTRSYPTMNTGIFHDAAYSFETTLQDGENSIKEFMDVPKNQTAFNHGDNSSYTALQNVIENQKGLLQNLEDIKQQLARAYQDQFSPSKSKKPSVNPDNILDIGSIMSMRDAAQEHITSTSRSLKELARRIEARETPQPQSQSQSQSQQRPRSQQQTPYRPAPPQPDFESVPDMPPRPPPQRPLRQPVPQQQTVPQSPMSPTSTTVDPNAKIPNPIAVHSVGATPGAYCTGALRLQRDSSLTIRDILRDSKDPAAPLLCRYCNLRLGDDDFRDAVMQGQRKGTAIAKQHMLACATLWDRRAMFKCLLCTNEEADSEFRDVVDFKAHMKCH